DSGVPVEPRRGPVGPLSRSPFAPLPSGGETADARLRRSARIRAARRIRGDGAGCRRPPAGPPRREPGLGRNARGPARGDEPRGAHGGGEGGRWYPRRPGPLLRRNRESGRPDRRPGRRAHRGGVAVNADESRALDTIQMPALLESLGVLVAAESWGGREVEVQRLTA